MIGLALENGCCSSTHDVMCAKVTELHQRAQPERHELLENKQVPH